LTQAKKKISSTLVLVFIPSFVIILLATILTAQRINEKFKESIIEQWTGQLNSITQISALNIESYFSKFGENLLTIAGNPEVQKKLHESKPDNLDTGYCCIKNLYDVHANDVNAILLLNANKEIVLGYPAPLFSRVKSCKRIKSAFKMDHLKKGEIYVSDVFINRKGKQVFIISTGIYDKDIYLGIVSWVISVKRITSKYLAPVTIGQNSYIWMLDTSDQILAHHDTNSLGLNVWDVMDDFEATERIAGLSREKSEKYRKESRKFFTRIKNSVSGSGHYIDFVHGDYCLANFRQVPVHSNRWTLISNLPYSNILAPIRKNTIKIYSLSGVVILVLSLLLLFLLYLQRSRQLLSKESEYHQKAAARAEQLKDERQKKLKAQIDGQEIERTRVSREIHDGLGQYLLSLKVRLEEFYQVIPSSFNKKIEDLRSIFQKTIDETRRISNNLIPVSLEELGLITSIKNLCHDFSDNTHIPTDFVSHGIPEEKINMKIKTYLYRICQETLNNVYKHAGANEVNVQLLGNNEQLTLIIQDDGKGFQYNEGYLSNGNGLNNIRDRAEILSGTCQIDTAPTQGTIVTIKIPLI
jgi:signal transduction histidine kinase